MIKSILIAAGMRRGGSTLQYQLICDVLQAAGIPCVSEWVKVLGDEDLASSNASGVVRVIKTHAIPSCSEACLSSSNVQCFYICRDPRDALVSFLAKYESAYTDNRAASFIDLIHREFVYWSGRSGVHAARYETVISAIANEVSNIARVIGIELQKSQVEEIARSRSIENQKKRIKDFDWESAAIRIGVDLIDPNTQLHSNHIRTGGAGSWKQELNPGAILFLETQLGQCITGMGYDLATGKWSRLRYKIVRSISR